MQYSKLNVVSLNLNFNSYLDRAKIQESIKIWFIRPLEPDIIVFFQKHFESDKKQILLRLDVFSDKDRTYTSKKVKMLETSKF